MILTNVEAVRDYIIETVDGFTIENCDVENTTVFDNILTMNPSPMKCMVIGFGGQIPTNQPSEFGGLLTNSSVVANLFMMLWGTDQDRHEQILEGYRQVDLITRAILDNNTLGGRVMDATMYTVHPPLTYNRSEMNEYLLLVMDITVKDNLYG